MNEWVSLLQTFGISVCILMFIGLCLWKTAPWVAGKCIEPIIDRIVKLLDALIISVVKQAETMDKVGVVMTKLGDALEKQMNNVVNMAKEVDPHRR